MEDINYLNIIHYYNFNIHKTVYYYKKFDNREYEFLDEWHIHVYIFYFIKYYRNSSTGHIRRYLYPNDIQIN